MLANENDLTLEEVALLEDLSVRSINVCQSQGINSLKELLTHFYNNKSFLDIRNCGLKSEKELIDICNKYDREILTKAEKTIDTLFLINKFSPFERSFVNKYYDLLVSNLSVRAKNGLIYLEYNEVGKSVLVQIYELGFNFRTIKNIGKKTYDELQSFKIDLQGFIKKISDIDKFKLNQQYSELTIRAIFKDSRSNFDNLFDASGKLKLFTFLKSLTESDSFFSNIENDIFSCIYTNTVSGTKGLAIIAEKHSLTRERIRQIKLRLDQNIFFFFSFLSNFTLSDIIHFGIDEESDLICIDNQFLKRANMIESVDFTQEFYTLIFGIILKRSHTAKFGLSNPQQAGASSLIKRKWLNGYLIHHDFLKTFDLDSFFEDLYDRVNERIQESYSLHFSGYIYQYINVTGEINQEVIKSICESIMFSEFTLILDHYGYLNFEKNTKSQLRDYCMEIFNTFHKVLSVDELEEKIVTKYPDLKITKDSIRGTLNREKDLFIYFGRSSTYGLRVWEIDMENVKGGTIRSIIQDFLGNQDRPMHISEILGYLLKYRPGTNEKSILANIKLDESHKFCFYASGYIGLNSKKYLAEDLDFKTISGQHFRRIILNKMNGWSIESVVNHYVIKYGYQPIQVQHILQRKESEGFLKISNDNKIIL